MIIIVCGLILKFLKISPVHYSQIIKKIKYDKVNLIVIIIILSNDYEVYTLCMRKKYEVIRPRYNIIGIDR